MAEKFAGEDMLKAILDKNPDSLVEEERAILRARISYLTSDQIKKFGVAVKKVEAPKTKKSKK